MVQYRQRASYLMVLYRQGASYLTLLYCQGASYLTVLYHQLIITFELTIYKIQMLYL